MQVPFVADERLLNHAENDKAQLVELPYEGIPGLSFYILLPKTRDGLQALESSLSVEQIRALKTSASTKKVNLKFPKFTVRQRIDLKEVLEKLGVHKMFSQQADFSRLTTASLKVDAAVHETFIKVWTLP